MQESDAAANALQDQVRSRLQAASEDVDTNKIVLHGMRAKRLIHIIVGDRSVSLLLHHRERVLGFTGILRVLFSLPQYSSGTNVALCD